MVIRNIKLQNFRNFLKKEINFGEKLTIIYGTNASGKTNILEAVNILATGKSFKAKLEEEMVNYDHDIARVIGSIVSVESITDLEVVLTRGEINLGEGNIQKAPKKKLMLNGVSKRLIDFTGNLKTVVFGPWDMELVTDSPSIRRKFLDNVLSAADREYQRASLSYEKGLRQRNRLLYRIREENLPRTQLLFWNTLLIKNGNYITQKREEFIEYVNSTRDFPATEFIKKNYGGKKLDFNLIYDRSVISEGRLTQYANEEIASATTLVGPHRDDFVFQLKNEKTKKAKEYKDLAAFGSRGEQRMGVLWIKMAELKYIEKVSEEVPVLILDDIYSELDHEHRDIVMEFVSGKNEVLNAKIGQVILTTADEHFIKRLEDDGMTVISL